MAGAGGTSVRAGMLARVGWVFIGEDGRLRATYRVLLAWPVLWFLAGSFGIAAGANLGLVPTGASLPTAMLVNGLLQAAFFAVVWIGWARYVDRRPLGDYGCALAPSWWLDLGVAFSAVVAGHVVWYAVGAALGWTSVSLSLSGPTGLLPYGLMAVFLALGINIWVQEMVFSGIQTKNAAEGLASRGLTPERAVLIGWGLAVVLYAAKHRPSEFTQLLNYSLVLGVFALLYVHTGELALSIGVHLGVNFGAFGLFASAAGPAKPTIFAVTETIPGLLGFLSGGRVPQVLVAYLLLLGWLRWRRGEVTVRPELARWRRPKS